MTLKHPNDEVAQTLARNWQQSAVLDPQVLQQLYEINRIYLDFLIADHTRRDEAQQSLRGLASDVHRPIAAQQRRGPRLEHLSPAARLLLAHSPFSLFAARFHDGRFWLSELQATGVSDSAPGLFYRHRRHSESTAFADLALFYSWHLVQLNLTAARVLLGMSEQTLTAFKQLPLLRIQQLASERPELVTLRWPERSAFWRGLLNLAQRGAEERLNDMRLLGIQMIASELALSHSSA